MQSQMSRGIGALIKQKRVSVSLTLRELSEKSGVSQSHIGRIERGERFPSAHVLKKIALPLGFEEEELFALAGFLSDKPGFDEDLTRKKLSLDPLVANLLAQEPVEMQRAVIDIFNLLKIVAKNIKNSDNK